MRNRIGWIVLFILLHSLLVIPAEADDDRQFGLEIYYVQKQQPAWGPDWGEYCRGGFPSEILIVFSIQSIFHWLESTQAWQ